MSYKDQEKGKEYQKRWNAANKDKLRAASVRYRENNPDKCKAATARWSAKNPDRVKATLKRWVLAKKYSLTLEDYQELLDSSGGVCAICDQPFNFDNKKMQGPCVDHDHETQVIRGLLCHRCNIGIGIFKDNPDLLLSAAEYLRSK